MCNKCFILLYLLNLFYFIAHKPHHKSMTSTDILHVFFSCLRLSLGIDTFLQYHGFNHRFLVHGCRHVNRGAKFIIVPCNAQIPNSMDM